MSDPLGSITVEESPTRRDHVLLGVLAAVVGLPVAVVVTVVVALVGGPVAVSLVAGLVVGAVVAALVVVGQRRPYRHPARTALGPAGVVRHQEGQVLTAAWPQVVSVRHVDTVPVGPTLLIDLTAVVHQVLRIEPVDTRVLPVA